MDVSVDHIQQGKPGSWFRNNFIPLLMLSASLAVITCYFHHFTFVSSPNSTLLSMNHLAVVSGEAKAPLQYRFAPYFIAQGIQYTAVKLGAPNNSEVLVFIYFCIRAVLMTAVYLALLYFLGIWFDIKRAILGLCFFVAVNPLAEYYYFHQPGDPWILLFFVLSYIAIARKWDILLIPIVFFAFPFHESIALIIPAYFFARLGEVPLKSVIIWTLVLCLVWLIPYIGVRLIFGILPEIMDEKLAASPYTSVLNQNLSTPKGWVVLFLCFNVLWFAVPAAWSSIPSVVRRMFGMVPIYLVVYLIHGHLVEGRHFMPLEPLFIIAGLAWLGQIDRNRQGLDSQVS